MGFDSPIWIPLLAVATYVAATRGGIYYLLMFNLAASLLFSNGWSAGGIQFGPTDMMLGAVAYLVLSGRDSRLKTVFWKLPGIRLWIALGIGLSISYSFVPLTASHMTDPVRAIYQIYRYCWQPLFFFPLAMIVSLNPDQAAKILRFIVVLGVLNGGYSIVQVLSGQEAAGFFNGKNMLSGALAAPAVAALGATISGRRSIDRIRWLGCLGVIVLALMFAGSRGAVVATAAGFACLAMPLTRYAGSRRRLIRLGIAGALVAVLGFAVMPSEGPIGAMDTLSELSEGTQVDNLQWRLQLRWPHFFAKALEHPWVGIGTDHDYTLGESANTPHNGYLSYLVRRGFPSAIAWTLLALRCALIGIRAFNRRRSATAVRFLGLTSGAAVVAILVHNLVESTFVAPWISQVFLICAGIAASSAITVAKPAFAAHAKRRSRVRRKSPPAIIPEPLQ